MTVVDDQVAAGKADWQRRAPCRERPQGFFPVEGEQPAERADREELARAVCRGCPVQQPCLDLALELGVVEGIWGGLTPRERSVLHRRTAQPPRD